MKSDDAVWVVVMFDLPVDTAQKRKIANKYRVKLLNLGFSRVQLSVYCKYLISASGVAWLSHVIEQNMPDAGTVRMLTITDTQWAKMLYFEGKKQGNVEPPPEQLLIF